MVDDAVMLIVRRSTRAIAPINRRNKLLFDNITVKMLAPGGTAGTRGAVKGEGRGTSREHAVRTGLGRGENPSKEPSLGSRDRELGSLSLEGPSSHFRR